MGRQRTPRVVLVASFFVAAVACGGRVSTSPPTGDAGAGDAGALLADASGKDASIFDSKGAPDSRAAVDVTRTPDAPLDVTKTRDAPVADRSAPSQEASVDAPVDAIEVSVDAPFDVHPVKEAGRDAKPNCDDLCLVGEMECNYDAFGCDSSASTVCVSATLSTCMLGSSGCTVWGPSTACSPSYGCCRPCQNTPCVDGGEPRCLACALGPVGSPCTQDAECGSNACDGITDTCDFNNPCSDRRQDNQETDVDCGGPNCKGCDVGQRCGNNFDCVSGHFCTSAHVCQ
jgi:hypothetical protein